MIGMHGTKASNLGVSECDLLIALGARFSDRVTGNPHKFAENAKIIQIDIDAAEINKNIRVNAGVVGDLKLVLQHCNRKLTRQDHGDWMKRISELKEKYPLKYDDSQLSCPYIIEMIDKVTGGDALITTDVGQHQMWTAQYFHYTKPRTFLSSGGLGTMGYGLGACIGAQVGQPDKICFNISGDGCFRMNMNELATASRYNIPIIDVVINNHVLGMVRQWQTLFYGKRYSPDRAERQGRLQQGGGGSRLCGNQSDKEGRGTACAGEGDCHEMSCRDRVYDTGRRQGISDGSGGCADRRGL